MTEKLAASIAAVVTVWLSGGTAGEEYTVACKVVTSDSRTDERSMNIIVADR